MQPYHSEPSIKTKNRNRLSTEMLSTIIRIRCTLQCNPKCGIDSRPSGQMLEVFLTRRMYLNSSQKDEDDLRDFV